jgi:hypothetical protein
MVENLSPSKEDHQIFLDLEVVRIAFILTSFPRVCNLLDVDVTQVAYMVFCDALLRVFSTRGRR